jgi:hypothetical protein
METPASSENVKSVERVEQLMAACTSLRRPIYRTLELCEEPRTSKDIEIAIGSFIHGQVSIYTPAVIFAWLRDADALESVPGPQPDTAAEMWITTAAGRRILDKVSPGKQLTSLLDGDSKYRESYLRMLVFCIFPRDREEIEKHFEIDPALEEPKVYPSALIGELEAAGGIEWNKKWQTTELAKEFLE